MNRTYLGDGVTIELTAAGDFMLSTPRQDTEHFIFLDFDMIERLAIYADHIKKSLQHEQDTNPTKF